MNFCATRWCPFGDLISQRRSGATTYYLFDALGSTDRLISAAQAVLNSYVYKAFGEIAASTGSTTNPFRFVGRYGYYYYGWSVGSDLYVRARWYKPVQARWLSVDPLGFRAGEWNLYRYGSNSPLTWIDMDGQQQVNFACCACEKAKKDQGGSDISVTVMKGNGRKKTCPVNVECASGTCEGGSVGFTKPDSTTNSINVCISCYFSPPDLVLLHELVHAKQLCLNKDVFPADCGRCLDRERDAYRVSCKVAFGNKGSPGTTPKEARCIACGIRISCATACEGDNRKLKLLKPPCTIEDLGGNWDPGHDPNPGTTW